MVHVCMAHLLMDCKMRFMLLCASSHLSRGSGVQGCNMLVSCWMFMRFSLLNFMMKVWKFASGMGHVNHGGVLVGVVEGLHTNN